MKPFLHRYLAVFALIICASMLVNARGGGNVPDDLVLTINDFGKRHDLSGQRMKEMLGELVLNEVLIAKGGVGVVDRSVRIILRSPRNSLDIDNVRWDGNASSESQVVLIEDRRVVRSESVSDFSRLKMVLFSKDEVRFIDFSSNTGGRYRR